MNTNKILLLLLLRVRRVLRPSDHVTPSPSRSLSHGPSPRPPARRPRRPPRPLVFFDHDQVGGLWPLPGPGSMLRLIRGIAVWDESLVRHNPARGDPLQRSSVFARLAGWHGLARHEAQKHAGARRGGHHGSQVLLANLTCFLSMVMTISLSRTEDSPFNIHRYIEFC